MRIIALEEHFASPAFLAGPGREFGHQLRKSGERGVKTLEQLQDLGAKRIADMDAAGIDLQVLSLNSPGVEQADAGVQISVARESNDFLAGAVEHNPKRLAAFACLPIAVPNEAADELERRVRRQDFKGALINGHTRGRYLDDRFFSPILERAEALNIPIYLHPTLPPPPVVDAIYSGFSAAVTATFAGSGWGWHIETSVHLIRMILGGVFDRHPDLQIIIGHLGEGISFMLPRLNMRMPREITRLARPVRSYLRENVHYTLGGFNFPTTFQNLLLEVGAGRIMFSADYPFGSMAEARAFLEQLPVSPPERGCIAHANAERLLRL